MEFSDDDVSNIRSEISLDPPLVDGDLLEFRDSSHFKNYYIDLNNLYDSNLDSFITSVTKSDSVNTVFEKLSTNTFTDTSNMYRPFLSDPIMQSFANEYFEFKIGDVLVTYINNDEVLIINETNSGARQSIRALDKGSKLELSDIPNGAYWGTDEDFRSFLRLPCSCQINIEQIGCDELRVFGSCKGLLWGDGEGEVEIYVSSSSLFPHSGTPIQTHTVDGNFEFLLDENSILAPSGIFYLHASADPDCFAGSTQYATIKYNPQFSCDRRERKTGYGWKTDGYSQGFSYRVSYYKTWISSYEESFIWSKYHDGSRWRLNKADLDISIFADRRNDECNKVDYDSDRKVKRDDKMRVRVNTGVNNQDRIYHCTNDVLGSFSKKWTWQGTNYEISATGVLPFDCCD